MYLNKEIRFSFFSLLRVETQIFACDVKQYNIKGQECVNDVTISNVDAGVISLSS